MVNIFHLMLVLLYIYIYIYIYSTNIPPIMIINRKYETQKSSVAVACFLPGRAKGFISTPVLADVFCLMIRIFRLMLVLLYI